MTVSGVNCAAGIRSSVQNSPPKLKKSLLGPPPLLMRTPGVPKPLTVHFFNQFGYPRKLLNRTPTLPKPPMPKASKSHSRKVFKTKEFSNKVVQFRPCSQEDLKHHSVALPNLAEVTACEIIREVLDNLTVQPIPAMDTVEVTGSSSTDSPPAQDESIISINDSNITNILGDPMPDSLPSPQPALN